ncbi:MAG: cytoplasmic protein [Deltaproteobacteria bacterium]|nr:cytoplasmic protein [Deltaproteobacteria bacterium]
MPARHQHRFVETYEGMIAFGYSREDDERSLIAFLQKFSDDEVMRLLSQRLTDNEIEELFDHLSQLLKRHLTGEEYHLYFLKE